MQLHPPLQEYIFEKWFKGEPSPAAHLLVVSVISLVPVLVTQPFDVIRIRMQASTTKYSGFFDCLRSIVRDEGVHYLWSGGLYRAAAFVTHFCISTGVKGLLANRYL